MDDKEESLFSGRMLFLFCLVVVLILLVLFPGGKLLENLNKNSVDRTSVEYLRVLIDKNAEDGQLKIRLANELVTLGKAKEAEAILALLLTNEAFQDEAQFLTIKIQFQQYFELRQAALKQNKKEQLLSLIVSLYPRIEDISWLDLLAQWSEELAEPALAAKIYGHIIAVLGNKNARQTNNNRDFIGLLLGIKSAYAEETNNNADYYALKQLQALLAANQLDEALSQAMLYVPKFKHSNAILDIAIKIASSANAPVQSRNWGRLSLLQFGADKEKLQQQITRELAANEPINSLLWVKFALVISPEEPQLLAFGADLASELGEKALVRGSSLKLLAKPSHDSVLDMQSTHAEETTKNADHYVVKQLQALLAANKLDEALSQSTLYVPKFKHSKAILDLAIKIAGYANAPVQSRNWGRLLLLQFGSDKEKLQQQIARELAANEPINSLLWVKFALVISPEEPKLLAFGARLASGLGEKTLARGLSLKLLAKNPHDPDLLAQMVQYELALQNLPSALVYAQQRVALEPENIAARKQLAEIALWKGDPKISAQNWVLLYQKTRDETFARDALRIGKSIFDYDLVATVYADLSATRRLTSEELTDLYQTLQAQGNKDGGAQQLKRYIKQYVKHKQAWIYLAKTEELTGFYLASAKTLQKAEQILGRTTQLSQLQAEMLLKAGEFPSAWHLLQQVAVLSKPEESTFWQLYAKIAWLSRSDTEVKKAYTYLLNSGELELGAVSRLLELSGKNKKQKLDFLVNAWAKFKQPTHLLDAINLSLRLKKPQQVARLIAIAGDNIHLFENNVRYWVIKASIASRKRRRSLAKKYLLRALALDSQSVDTRISLLWHLIDYGADADLREFLNNSALLAKEGDVELWQALAAGYRRLGDPVHAIVWYLRSLKQQPEDYLTLLNYAEASMEAGDRAKANKIRRFIMTRVRPKLVARLSQKKFNIAEFKRRYGVLILDELGIDISDKWFSFAQKENDVLKQAVFDEYRITWMLAKGRMQQARYHALKKLHERVDLAAWQQMAIAVYDNDIDAIEAILKTPSELLPTDRVVGLRTVGRELDALKAARNYLAESQRENELLILRRQAADLGVRNPNGLAVAGKMNNISELDLWSVQTTAAITRGVNTFWMNYEHLGLSSSNRTNLFIHKDQKQENNLRLKWRYRGLRNEFWLQAHADLRADQDLYGVEMGVRHRLWEGWSIGIEGAYNELSNESAAFRLLGARDRITLGLNGEISKRDYFVFNVHGRNYKSRSGDYLGIGYGIEFDAGYRVKYAQPTMTISLNGSLSESNLVTTLPEEIQVAVEPGHGMESVLAKRYKQMGMNFKLYDSEYRPFGFVERSFHYYLDTGIFFSVPYSGPGVSIEAGIGGRLLGHDDLSLIGRYAGVQGGVNALSTKSIELRYSFRFD